MIKAFESTFELAWKTTKDYLELQGIDCRFPREVIKSAFEYGIIEDGHRWIEMLDYRNIFLHTYDKEQALNSLNILKNNFIIPMEQVYNYFKKKL